MSQTSLIQIVVSVDNQEKCNIRPRPIEVDKTTLNQYFCNICTYFATQKGILKKHQKIKHGVKCYSCDYCKDKVNRKNDLVEHLKNHHEDCVNNKNMNFYAISTPQDVFYINEFVYKEKDEVEPEVDIAERESEPHNKFNEGIDTNTSQRKSLHSKKCEICGTNMKWDIYEKQISCINPVILEPLMLPAELRQTASAIGQLEEKLSENCGEDISDKERPFVLV